MLRNIVSIVLLFSSSLPVHLHAMLHIQMSVRLVFGWNEKNWMQSAGTFAKCIEEEEENEIEIMHADGFVQCVQAICTLRRTDAPNARCLIKWPKSWNVCLQTKEKTEWTHYIHPDRCTHIFIRPMRLNSLQTISEQIDSLGWAHRLSGSRIRSMQTENVLYDEWSDCVAWDNCWARTIRVTMLRKAIVRG